MFKRNLISEILTVLLLSLFCFSSCKKYSPPQQSIEEPLVFKIFKDDVVHFTPDDSTKFDSATAWATDKGRVINSYLEIPEFEKAVKITAFLSIKPIPKDYATVYDHWDRAGSIRLIKEGMPDIEMIKFMTAYGGFSDYEVDVSHLAPLLKEHCEFKAFIDTWVSPGWKIDFKLQFEEVTGCKNPEWAEALFFENSYDKKSQGEEGIEVEIEIPKNLNHVQLNYLVSGHCTDGRDADEFIPKDNVIYIDGEEVHRFRPWRDDCRKFREFNPYTKKYSNGVWSSDYSRSGWCPGDKVDPTILDFTEYLIPGKHTVKLVIENVRPEDENGNYGYWRVSGHLLGWK